MAHPPGSHVVCEECLTVRDRVRVVVAGSSCDCGHTPATDRENRLTRRELVTIIRQKKGR